MRGSLALALLAAASSPALAQVSEFTQEQSNAFALGAGVAGASEILAFVIAVIIAALAFGGVAWIAYAAFQNWTDGRMSAGGVATLLLRAAALLIIAGIFLR